MFSGLQPEVGIQTASFYGGVTLSGTVSGGRNNLGNTVQIKYLLSQGKIQLIKTGTGAATMEFSFSDLDTADSGNGVAVFQKGTVTIPFSTTTLPKEVLELHVPSINGVPLSYTRFGTYLNLNISLTTQKIDPLAAFVFGQPTVNTPTSGSATYTADLAGAVVVPNGLSPSLYTLGGGDGSATFSANFANGTVATLIDLDPEGTADFGEVSGTGSIVSGGPGFNGTLSGSGTGGFTGAFFGPNAVEMGYVFNVANGTNWIAYGNVFGTTAPSPAPTP